MVPSGVAPSNRICRAGKVGKIGIAIWTKMVGPEFASGAILGVQHCLVSRVRKWTRENCAACLTMLRRHGLLSLCGNPASYST